MVGCVGWDVWGGGGGWKGGGGNPPSKGEGGDDDEFVKLVGPTDSSKKNPDFLTFPCKINFLVQKL